MHNRLDQSIGRSWIILGRVVARQNVLRLRGDHDELRSAFAELRVADSLDPVAVQSLVEKEAAFEATLTQNERGLVRSEGREWVGDVRSELDELISLRAALADQWQRLDAAEADFMEARGRAREVANKIPEPPQPVAEPAVTEISRFVGPPILDTAPFVGPLLSDSPPVSAIPQPETRVTRQETDTSKKQLVAWVTGGVLLIVLIISIGTVTPHRRPDPAVALRDEPAWSTCDA